MSKVEFYKINYQPEVIFLKIWSKIHITKIVHGIFVKNILQKICDIAYLDIDAVPRKIEDAIVKGGINELPSNRRTNFN